MMRHERWAISFCLAFGCLATAYGFMGLPPEMGHQEWPADPEWVELTNCIQRCYDAVVLRCEVAGVATNGLPRPSFVYPTVDFLALADKIDELAPSYVCQTNADASGSFEDALAQDGEFPTWTAEHLHRAAFGAPGWATDDARFWAWMFTDHAIQTQVIAAVSLLVWTEADADQLEWAGPEEGPNDHGWWRDSYVSWSAATSAEPLYDPQSNPDAPRPYRYNEGYYQHYEDPNAEPPEEWSRWFADAYAVVARLLVTDLLTNVPHVVDFYAYAAVYERGVGEGEWHAYEDPLLCEAFARFASSATCSLAIVVSDYLSSSNPPTAWPAEPDEESPHHFKGYEVTDELGVIKWQFPTIPLPTIYPNAEGPADTDRDDLVDVGADIDTFGRDTGTAVVTPEDAGPVALIPLAAAPLWDAGPRAHAYISQSATNLLPYQYLAPWVGGVHDCDGYYQTYSLDTAVLEFVRDDTPGHELKRAVLRRPRGQIVVFDFPWDGDAFSELGYPTGIHSNRTYVLRHVDLNVLNFDLTFESGIVHGFTEPYNDICEGGSGTGSYASLLAGITHVDGYSACYENPDWISIRSEQGKTNDVLPGAIVRLTNGIPTSASNIQYTVDLTWDGGRVSTATYAPHGGEASIVSSFTYDEGGRMTGIAKVCAAAPELAATGVSLGENAVTNAWGTVTRDAVEPVGEGTAVQLTCALTGGGGWTERTDFNRKGYVTRRLLSSGGLSRTNAWAYSTESGRYTNGFPRCSKIVACTNALRQVFAMSYDEETGWIESLTTTLDGSLVKTVSYAYSPAHGGMPADERLVFEYPRVTTVTVAGQTVSRRLLSLTDRADDWRSCGWADGYADWTTQDCVSDGATWGNAANLYTTNSFSTRPSSSSASVETPNTSRWIGAAIDDGQGVLTESYSTGRTIQTVVNPFGHMASRGVWENDLVTDSAVALSVDAFGRPLTVVRDGCVTNQYAQYGLHGPGSITEPGGSTVVLTYDALGRVTREVRTSPALTREITYDSMGNVTAVLTSGGGLQSTETWTYDLLGRRLSYGDSLGTSTWSYAATAFGTRCLAQFPHGGEMVLDCHFDGSPRETSGSGAVAHRRWNYELADGQLAVRETAVGAGGAVSEWSRVRFDFLNRPCRVDRAGVAGYDTLAYDGESRLIAITDASGVVRRQTYTAAGLPEHAGIDLDRNGSLDAAGADPFGTSTRTVNAAGVEVSQAVYPFNGSAASAGGASIARSLDNRTVSVATPRATAQATRGAFLGNGAFDVETVFSDGRRRVTRYEHWRPAWRTSFGGSEPDATASLEYDGLGALSSVWRSGTGTTRLVRDAARRITQVVPSDPGKSPVVLAYKPHTDWVTSVTGSDGRAVLREYAPNGLLLGVSGAAYRMDFSCDTQGRLVGLSTIKDGQTNTTTWVYDSQTGRLVEKKLNATTIETRTYRDNGQLATVTDADGNALQLAYDNAGGPTGFTFTDGETAAMTCGYNRLRQPTSIALAGGIAESNGWSIDGLPLTNAVSGNGIVADASLCYRYATTHDGLTNMTWAVGGGVAEALSVGYDARSLVSNIVSGPVSIFYTYATNAPVVLGASTRLSGAERLRRDVDWDLTNSRVRSLVYTLDGTNPVASFTYSYVTNADRIARVTLLDGSWWQYEYDTTNQLTRARRYQGDGSPFLGQQFGYAYDGIGNTVRAGRLDAVGAPVHRFEADAFNTHVERTWGGDLEVRGSAVTNAFVTVNDVPADRQDGRFYALVPVANTAQAVRTNVTVYAAVVQTTNDLVAAASGTVYVARATEPVTHAARGVIDQDSRFDYAFDWLGRLTNVATRVTPGPELVCDYYPDGRRARKRVYDLDGQTRTLRETRRFHYDRWNLIREEVTAGTTTLTRVYIWGLDLAGWRNGKLGAESGGIGGLVAIEEFAGATTNVYLPICDHNGNIHKVIDASDGSVVANYEYSPFGVLIGECGEKMDVCPFRFQSKYYDHETQLYYFGYRYYDPASTKWLTRDPLGEAGGINLTAFCGNDPINRYDALGLKIEVLPINEQEVKTFLDSWEGMGWAQSSSEEVIRYLRMYRSVLEGYLSGIYEDGISGNLDMKSPFGANNQLGYVMRRLRDDPNINIRLKIDPRCAEEGITEDSDYRAGKSTSILVSLGALPPSNPTRAHLNKMAVNLLTLVHESMHVIEAIMQRGTNRALTEDKEFKNLYGFIQKHASLSDKQRRLTTIWSPRQKIPPERTSPALGDRYLESGFDWYGQLKQRNPGFLYKGHEFTDQRGFILINNYLGYWLLGFDPMARDENDGAMWPNMKYHPERSFSR